MTVPRCALQSLQDRIAWSVTRGAGLDAEEAGHLERCAECAKLARVLVHAHAAWRSREPTQREIADGLRRLRARSSARVSKGAARRTVEMALAVSLLSAATWAVAAPLVELVRVAEVAPTEPPAESGEVNEAGLPAPSSKARALGLDTAKQPIAATPTNPEPANPEPANAEPANPEPANPEPGPLEQPRSVRTITPQRAPERHRDSTADAPPNGSTRANAAKWDEVAKALRVGDARLAEAHLADLAAQVDEKVRDAARLSRAELRLSRGELHSSSAQQAAVEAELRELARAGSTSFVRERALALLASLPHK